MNPHRVIVLLNAPRPGIVKARLAAALDAEAAAAIARVLIDRTLAALRPLSRLGIDLELRVAPDDATTEADRWRQPGWTIRPQGEGDFSERLSRAIAEAFAENATRVVVIGTDCPNLTSEDVADAFTALSARDVVLGPANHGGCWLIGLRAPTLALFDGAGWRVSSAFATTCARAQASGLSVGQLHQLDEVESLEDWRHWLRTFKY